MTRYKTFRAELNPTLRLALPLAPVVAMLVNPDNPMPTVKARGITSPQSLLLRADEVIR